MAARLACTVDDVRRELTGRDLACWCPEDELCHADVLLRVANDPGPWRRLLCPGSDRPRPLAAARCEHQSLAPASSNVSAGASMTKSGSGS